MPPSPDTTSQPARAAVVPPVYLNFREEAATKALTSNVLGTTKGGKSATCRPVGERGVDGLRTYRCTVTLTTGKSRTTQVSADEDGNLQPAA